VSRKYLRNKDNPGKIDVIRHIRENFKTMHTCPLPIEQCGFCRPGFNEIFEVIEPIEFSVGLFGKIKCLDVGLYRIYFEAPSCTSHGLLLQRFEKGIWLEQFYIDGGWSGANGKVIDWRGIRPIKI
jgi:hypothetical protein